MKNEMDAWYTCNLGDAMLAGDALDKIKALYLLECGKNSCPKDLVIFIRHESEGQLHCEVKLFFPPVLKSLALALAATPCKKPSPSGLDVLIGTNESRSVYF